MYCSIEYDGGCLKKIVFVCTVHTLKHNSLTPGGRTERATITNLLVKRDRMLEAARSVRAGRMGQKDEGKQHPN